MRRALPLLLLLAACQKKVGESDVVSYLRAQPPDARAGHGEPEVRERCLHGVTLWIEDAGLRPDEDRELQRTTAGSSR